MNLKIVEKHLKSNYSYLKDKRLLIALSGGVDSVVLADIFCKLNYNISLAHCNFNLREKEADIDQKFCQDLANKIDSDFYTVNFDTENYASKNKISIQMAARELRYNWFHKLMEENSLDYLLTAHHLNDSLETFLINISRSTGLKGLLGIPEKGNIVRPLSIYSKSDIKEYAKSNDLIWREDKSNKSDKYLRNYIRLNVVPELENMNKSSNFLDNFRKTLDNLSEYNQIVESNLESVLNEVIIEQTTLQTIFDVEELLKLNPLKTYLHLIFKKYGFNETKDLINLLNNISGKQLFNEKYRIVKSRDKLFLFENIKLIEDKILIYKNDFESNNLDLNKFIEKLDFYKSHEIKIDKDKLVYPLRLRKKKEGDVFFPNGMKGSKKVSKYFKDEKLAVHQKEKIWLLENGDHKIIWVVGLRQDERFKIEEENKMCIIKL